MPRGWIILVALALLLVAGFLLVRCDIHQATTPGPESVPSSSSNESAP
jgi:hypothetical protein